MNLALQAEIKRRALASPWMDFPGFKIQAYHGGRLLVDLSVGQTYPYYDIASLTKIVFTTTYFIKAISQGKMKWQARLQSILPWYPHSKVKVIDLLNHTAGNQWWQPFYKEIPGALDLEQRYQQLLRLCREAPRSRSNKAVYSDIDFFLLGAVMMSIESKPLHAIWSDLKESHYPESHFHFNPIGEPQYRLSQYAPTERCPWRKKLLRGEVHDENAWALGGIAPHAGLFGRIEDLSAYGLMLRAAYLGERDSSFPAKITRRFTDRSLPLKRGDWGYGFMLPAPRGSSAGERLSKKSFGHTGFTGTSLWYDPQRDLLVSLLSNRVSPTRKQRGFVELRPRLHDWLVELLEGTQ